VDLAELDSLRVWLERRYPTQLREYSRRPYGYSCREHNVPYLVASWCEGFSSLRLYWRELWRSAELGEGGSQACVAFKSLTLQNSYSGARDRIPSDFN